jgi:hypothetical protein
MEYSLTKYWQPDASDLKSGEDNEYAKNHVENRMALIPTSHEGAELFVEPKRTAE